MAYTVILLIVFILGIAIGSSFAHATADSMWKRKIADGELVMIGGKVYKAEVCEMQIWRG